MILSDYIGASVFIGTAIVSREIWIQVQIAKIQRDITWIKKWMNNNGTRGGEE